MSGARKPVIFISYSHEDEPERPGKSQTQWLTFVVGFLRAAFVGGDVEIWLDKEMLGGADWDAEIERKLRECDVFVLLVSRHSMTSEYVVKKEIAAVREREKRGESVHFYPILLTPTPKAALKIVGDKNIRPRDAKPLSGFEQHEQAAHMNEAADEIAGIVENASVRAERSSAAPKFKHSEELKTWLQGQPREVAIAIAARAALRVLPSHEWGLGEKDGANVRRQFAERTLSLFRATALAHYAAKFRNRRGELRVAAITAASEATEAGISNSFGADAASYAADAVVNFEAGGDAAAAAAAAYGAARVANDAAGVNMWDNISADAATAQTRGALALCDAPLWLISRPEWVATSWLRMQSLLPKGEDWDVWVGWYEQRSQGVSRGEPYEWAYVDIPDGVWKQGPKVANARIRERLAHPSDSMDSDSNAPPAPVPNIISLYTYGWTATAQIAAIAGPQNLPLFPDFTSAADHRAALDAARNAMRELQRSLKQFIEALAKDSRNVNFEAYRPIVRAYLRQLPKAAGEGDIVNAHQHAQRLRRMYELEGAELPAAILTGLESALRCHGALASFYDIVRRHEAAIPGENWAKPFPAYAVANTRKTMRVYTPKYFEDDVPKGLRYVEASAPPEGPPRPAPEQTFRRPEPPLPEVPDERRSWERLIAGGYNALYGTFREGETRVPDRAEWEQAVRTLGTAVEPLLKWLEATKDQKQVLSVSIEEGIGLGASADSS